MAEPLYPNMVHEYYVARLRAMAARRAEHRAAVRSVNDVLRLQASVRRRLRACFGRAPERSPLNAVVTGRIRRDPYTIEKVIFESRPGFKVTGNLYVPNGHGPFPSVLVPCGHSGNGKAYDQYQALCSGLARRGFLTFIYDPIGQGERRQITRRIGWFAPGNCCHEHNQFGNRLALLGEFFGMWRTWDGIRALDYLLSRPEADRTRVGITGNSGGGTLTTYIAALDRRFTMAAPSCFVTTFRCNIENELPADSEQTPPGIIAAGLDAADYFVAQMPRPVLLLGQQNDYFDLRGLRETYEELRRLYGIVGRESDVQLYVGPGPHGYFAEGREALYGFFAERSGRPAEVRPSESAVEKDETLWAAPGGSVLKAGSRNMTLLLKERARTVAAARVPLGEKTLTTAIAGVLALPARRAVPHYRVLRARAGPSPRHAAHSLFTVETEPGIAAALHLYAADVFAYLPERRHATLFVPHVSSEDDVQAALAPSARELFAVDVRGMGLSQARTCNCADFFAPYGNDYMYAAHAQMLGEPYLGRRVHDLLCVLDLLAQACGAEVHVVGRGLGAVTAALAACLHPAVGRVTLVNAPRSYGAMMEHPVALWPRSAMAWGLLERFDLPDCYALLRRGKGLRLIEPWNHLMRPEGKRR
jgi:dienelactone hydrolase